MVVVPSSRAGMTDEPLPAPQPFLWYTRCAFKTASFKNYGPIPHVSIWWREDKLWAASITAPLHRWPYVVRVPVRLFRILCGVRNTVWNAKLSQKKSKDILTNRKWTYVEIKLLETDQWNCTKQSAFCQGTKTNVQHLVRFCGNLWFAFSTVLSRTVENATVKGVTV